ncbi:MAG: hypothetical protein ABW146_08685 [Candidatus Sedimenticola sp. 6PFRAG7]
MSKSFSVKVGTKITIANLITMTVEGAEGNEIKLRFDAPEGIESKTDFDGSMEIFTKSLSYRFGDGYRAAEHNTLGNLIGEIVDSLQEAPERPLTILTNAAKAPREDG